MAWKLLLTFLEGVLAFISPCVLPLLPMYLSFFAGEYIRDDKYSQRKALKGLLGFVIGFTIIFVILGASATILGQFLNENKLLLKKISGIIIIIFGLFYLGILKISFLNKNFKFKSNITSPTFIKTVIFGMLFSLGWTPCIGPFISSAIFMAASSDTLLNGILLLLSFSIGLSLPLILSALLFNYLSAAFDFIKKHYRTMKIISGIILIITGLLIYIGYI